MCITGFLTDFSLPQVFMLIEKGHQTGLLTLYPGSPTPKTLSSAYYIWVYRGSIVAVANRLDHQGLVSLMAQRRWLGDRSASDLLVKLASLCPINKPLGLSLKQKGLLTSKQLQSLFQVQVLQPILALFQLKVGEFQFDHMVEIPTPEMTGLSISATAITLMGLRTLQNWDVFANQLPNPNAGLVSIITSQPAYPLNDLEWQVWEYTNGTVSLKTIAKQLRLPLKTLQQIAFRLIAVGLVEEIFLFVDSPPTKAVKSLPSELGHTSERQPVSHSLLQNLLGFLGTQLSSAEC